MEIRKYCIFIISYKRAEFCRENTYRVLNIFKHNAPIYIICSDDDPTLEDYYRIYGKDNVLVFNKLDINERYKIDLADCYYGKNNKLISTVWCRTVQFEFAKKKGFEYFITLDDDYTSFESRLISYNKGRYMLRRIREVFRYVDFDTVAELMFRIIDSQPYISCVCFAQNGDFIGGISNYLIRFGYKFKAMNFIYGTTKKMFKYVGRMNEDVNKYLLDNNRGKLSLTLSDINLDQVTTQKAKGGMTDIYKNFGTWTKSFYSVIHNPSAVKIDTIGNHRETFRIHHLINYDRCTPKILNERYCKSNIHNQEIEYLKVKNNRVIEDKIFYLKDIDVNNLVNITYLTNSQDLNDIF